MPAKIKYFGVVEGFYRRPYTFEQRCDLIQYLAMLGLNTYVYGPKSDIYHRGKYHEKYHRAALAEFRYLNGLALKLGIRFNYALSPGPKPDLQLVIEKIQNMQTVGIIDFSLFFDDIKVPVTKQTAIEQTSLANTAFSVVMEKNKSGTLFFCPTQYRGFALNDYIATVAEKLHDNVCIFWTGKRVVSWKITEKDVNRITALLQRPPLIWDNLFANDYMPGVILKHPYRYREPEIVSKVKGILINPMNQYVLSKPLIFTAAKFFNDPFNYVPRKMWQVAILSIKNN